MNLRQLREKAVEATPMPGSQVIVVFGPKGGVGKTFVATSLAMVSSWRGKRKTLLLDMDLDSGDVSVHLDLAEGKSITDLVPYCSDLRPEVLSKFVSHHAPSSTDVIQAPSRPELSELIKPEQVCGLIEGARRHYHCIVVDTPPSADCDVLYECLERSDTQVLVVTQDLACLKQSRTSVELLRRLGHSLDGRTYVAVNQYHERSVLTKARIAEFLGLKKIYTICEDRENVDKSILDGQPVVMYGEASPAARDMLALAAEVTGIPPSVPEKRNRFSLRLFERRNQL